MRQKTKQNFFKFFYKLERERNVLNMIKGIVKLTRANLLLNCEILTQPL